MQAALDYLEEALEADPLCYEALVNVGELYNHSCQKLGLSEEEGAHRALPYFDRAIAAQPDLSEAYASKGLALVYLNRPEEAIACIDLGLARLDERPTTDIPPDVWVNIGESLYRIKAVALKELGQVAAGRQVLAEGLQRFPESEYLLQIVDKFLPEL